MKAARDEIMEREGLRTVRAIKEGNVYVLHTSVVAGQRQVIGLCYLAKWFHPELFPELDPGAVHQEMLKKFFGLEPEPEGMWGYPELE